MRPRIALPTALLTGLLVGLVCAALAPEAGMPARVLPQEPPAAMDPAWDIPIVHNEQVRGFVERFSGSQAPSMAVYLRRSGRYEGMIRETLRHRGLPEDLFYLSMVESGMNSLARSPAEAVGLWQFIPETGRRYGLRIDAWVDERRDPERSTDAAASYLTELYDRFGAWYLVAAAYNTGENRVGRVMREVVGSERGWDADFWRIRHRLPRETQNHVPRMVAAAIVGKDPYRHGLGRVERWAPRAAETVRVPALTSLARVAQVTGVGVGELRSLNPALLRDVTPPGQPYPLRIPEGRSVSLRVLAAPAPSDPAGVHAGAAQADPETS